MGLNIQTLSDVMRSRGAEDMAMQGQQDQRDMQKLQMMLTLKKLKEEADMKQQTGTMLKDLYRPAQPASAGTMGYGMGMDNQNAQPQLKQLMEQGGDFGMDNASAINSSAEYSNKGAPVPMMAPQAAQAGGIDPMQLAAGFERLAATTGDIEFLSKAQALRSGMQKEGFTLGEGQSRFGGDGKVIANVAKAPKEIDYNKPFLPDGSPNEAYQSFKMRDSKSGASNVSVRVDNKLGEGLAKEVGPIVADSRAIAEGAIKSIDTINRIESALNSGKIFTGPGANVKLQGAQIAQMLGVGGRDTSETLANTRATIQGLAKLSVAGRQELKGQGAITGPEQTLVNDAVSGRIDFTPAELKVVTGVARRVAKAQYDRHQKNIVNMRKKPELGGVADFYEVGDFPQDQPTQQAQPTQSKRQELSAPPPASQYAGKMMTTPEGTKFKSDGKNWVRQ